MKRLYIVDDHKMMQKGVKDYLEEALEQLQDYSYCLPILLGLKLLITKIAITTAVCYDTNKRWAE